MRLFYILFVANIIKTMLQKDSDDNVLERGFFCSLILQFSCFRHHPHIQQRWRVFGRRRLGLSWPLLKRRRCLPLGFRGLWSSKRFITDLKWICCSASNCNSIVLHLFYVYTSVLGLLWRICVNDKAFQVHFHTRGIYLEDWGAKCRVAGNTFQIYRLRSRHSHCALKCQCRLKDWSGLLLHLNALLNSQNDKISRSEL